MIDDDAFDGFGAITCRECGTSLELRWRRTRVTFDCRECGTSLTVARRAPHRSWIHRPAARVEATPTTPIPTGAPTP
ncbi:MAG TPA: hypothetical protein VGC94_01620 [Amnibacterium sp.]|jgi:predicted RNA-binding Zn-ribbon protein involved in translation (DUF1610 family)